MELSGNIKRIDRMPYEAGIELDNSDIEGLYLLSVSVADEAVLDAIENEFETCKNKYHFDCHVWLATNIKVALADAKHRLIQPSKGLADVIGCGVVINVHNEYDFDIAIEGLTECVFVSCKQESNVSVAQSVSFRGELHANM